MKEEAANIDDGYEELAKRIILQAVEDYWKGRPERLHLYCKQNRPILLHDHLTAKSFLFSDRLKALTGIPVEVLLSEDTIYAKKYKDC